MAEQDGVSPVERLVAIMARLRDPATGCPWDVAQDFASIAPYTIEEAYEVADAIDRGDFDDLRDELGDLLLQVVFHARMAQEAGHFGFDDVATSIAEKMLRRHPHVFGDAVLADAEAQSVSWEAIKQAERERGGDTDTSALAGIARGMPEWQRATKLQKRAARAGFEWPDITPVVAKLHEEIEEVRVELAADAAPERIEDEIGDVLFVCVNLARYAGVDPGNALRRANAKFERRFRRMEALALADGGRLDQLDLSAQEALWARAKAEEASGTCDSGGSPDPRPA